ncbi:hypothetical protein FRC18_009431 [Serendipita sp. 400]|nr:hypothetical protein FRC18_009431 [Serendipita sp. 400]
MLDTSVPKRASAVQTFVTDADSDAAVFPVFPVLTVLHSISLGFSQTRSPAFIHKQADVTAILPTFGYISPERGWSSVLFLSLLTLFLKFQSKTDIPLFHPSPSPFVSTSR